MGLGVRLGLAGFNFSSADGYWQWVKMCDEGGVDSIWQTDRMVSKEPILECMSAMAALAGATKNVKFGMNVASLALRDPILVAKQCATIDYLSNGRLLPAFGLGSNRSPDWKATGRPTKGRGKRMDEALELITRLWSEERVTFEGEHYQYENASISPRPVQNPLPCWIGGSADAAIERTAKFGTGWQAASESPERAGEVVADILAAVERQGRRMDPEHMGIGFNYRYGGWDDPAVEKAAKGYVALTKKDPKDGLAVGGVDEVMRKIEAYVDNGICKFILRPIGEGDEDLIKQTEWFIDEIIPAVEALNQSYKAKRQRLSA